MLKIKIFLMLFFLCFANLTSANEGKVWFCETQQYTGLYDNKYSDHGNFKFKFKVYKNKLVFKGSKVDDVELPLDMNSERNRNLLSDKDCFNANASDQINHDIFSFCFGRLVWVYIVDAQKSMNIIANCTTFD